MLQLSVKAYIHQSDGYLATDTLYNLYVTLGSGRLWVQTGISVYSVQQYEYLNCLATMTTLQ